MATRPQPHHVEWPQSDDPAELARSLAVQFENMDEMFEILFRDGEVAAVLPFEKEEDIVYFSDEAKPARLAIRDANMVLRTDGTVPEWDKVTLTSDVTGTLPIANGGTNRTATPTAGGVVYGTGTAYAINAAGTSGQALLSGGASAPTWGTSGAAQAQVMTRVVLGI